MDMVRCQAALQPWQSLEQSTAFPKARDLLGDGEKKRGAVIDMAAGKYKHPLLNREDNRLQVITVAEILAGERLDLPMARADAIKSAAVDDSDKQENLF